MENHQPNPRRKLIFQLALFALALLAFANKLHLQNFLVAEGWGSLFRLAEGAIDIFAWLSFGWLASGLIALLLLGGWESQRGRAIPKLLIDIINFGILLAVIISILYFVFNAPITGLVAGSSVIMAVLGLAITRMISDIFSGVALSMERAFSLGDWLQIEMHHHPGGFITGKVAEINWRATRLQTSADELMVIANSEMARLKFINISMPERHYRAEVQVTLSHTIPPPRVRRILLAALLSAGGFGVGLPEPMVNLTRFTERGVLWSLYFWVPDFSQNRQALAEVYEAVLRHLQIAGIDLAYNRVDQRLIPTDVLELEKRPLREGLLRRVELFDILDQEDLTRLAAAMVERTFQPREWIINQGDRGDSLFIVAEGRVNVMVQDVEWMWHIDPGKYFGEMSLLTGEPRSATVQAGTEVVCYEIDKGMLAPIFQKQPELLDKISQVIARRQQRLAEVQEGAEDKTELVEKEKASRKLLHLMRDFFGIKSS